MTIDRSHVLQAFLTAGKITAEEYQRGQSNEAAFNALVARVAAQNGKK